MRRGLADSRARAQADIRAGRVTVGGAPAGKPARLVAPDESIEVLGPEPRFVGRGGEKLDAALERFGVEVTGRRAIDCGASTGGFTDALLQRGAREVAAVDVGRAQLHDRLARDPRVRSFERTSVRGLEATTIGGPADVVVADLSFISLRTVAADLVGLGEAGADLVVLVKPQFEAGRVEASRGRGVISDPAIWERVLGECCDALVSQGAAIMGVMASPLLGADGNVEFLVHLRGPGSTDEGSRAGGDHGAMIAAAVAEAIALRGERG